LSPFLNEIINEAAKLDAPANTNVTLIPAGSVHPSFCSQPSDVQIQCMVIGCNTPVTICSVTNFVFQCIFHYVETPGKFRNVKIIFELNYTKGVMMMVRRRGWGFTSSKS